MVGEANVINVNSVYGQRWVRSFLLNFSDLLPATYSVSFIQENKGVRGSDVVSLLESHGFLSVKEFSVKQWLWK